MQRAEPEQGANGMIADCDNGFVKIGVVLKRTMAFTV